MNQTNLSGDFHKVTAKRISPAQTYQNTHPGDHLTAALESIGMNADELSRILQISAQRIIQILKGVEAITADTALRLGHYFGTGADFWMNLQKQYDLHLAENRNGKVIKRLPTFVDSMGMSITPGS